MIVYNLPNQSMSTQPHGMLSGTANRREKMLRSSTEQWNEHHRWRPRSTTSNKNGNEGTSVVEGEEEDEKDEVVEGEEDERSKSSTCLFSSARLRRQGTGCLRQFWVTLGLCVV